MTRLRVVAALLGVFLATSCATSSPEGRDGDSWMGDPLVRTRYGWVQGLEDRRETFVWKAIPFATPPVGELRWRAPVEPRAWSGVREERRWAEPCVQYTMLGGVIGSEDCLYLNVWRPSHDAADLPVYVWIHGGGNSLGWATQVPDYEGASFAAEMDAVYVSVNYRLGPLGWFLHPDLATGDPRDDSGNYGTLDLIRALEWVSNNILAFGGDPSRVTIAGESAGGINVLSLLVSPAARGLFSRAIVRSGAPMSAATETGAQHASEIAARIGVEIADLREVPARRLLRAYDAGSFGMIALPMIFTDGEVIPEEGYGAFVSGEYAKVEVLIGSNTDEVRMFLGWDGTWRRRPELYHALTRYGSDMWRADGVDGVADLLSSHPDQRGVYVYEFRWGSRDSAGASPLPGRWGERLGAAHALEVPFFGAAMDRSFLNLFAFTARNRQGREELAAAITEYLRGFIHGGVPSAPAGLPQWPRWSPGDGEPEYLVLNADELSAHIEVASGAMTREEADAHLRASVSGELYDEVLRVARENFVLAGLLAAQEDNPE